MNKYFDDAFNAGQELAEANAEAEIASLRAQLAAAQSDAAAARKAVAAARNAALEEAAIKADQEACGACRAYGEFGNAIRALKTPEADNG